MVQILMTKIGVLNWMISKIICLPQWIWIIDSKAHNTHLQKKEFIKKFKWERIKQLELVNKDLLEWVSKRSRSWIIISALKMSKFQMRIAMLKLSNLMKCLTNNT